MFKLLSSTPVDSFVRRILHLLFCIRFCSVSYDYRDNFLFVLIFVYVFLQWKQHIQRFWLGSVVDQYVTVCKAKVMPGQLLIVNAALQGLQSCGIVESHPFFRTFVRLDVGNINVFYRRMYFLKTMSFLSKAAKREFE